MMRGNKRASLNEADMVRYVGGVEDESDQAYGIKYYRSIEKESDPKKNMEFRLKSSSETS